MASQPKQYQFLRGFAVELRGSDENITALTDDGIKELRDMLTAARDTTKTWHEFLNDFVDDAQLIARIKAEAPR